MEVALVGGIGFIGVNLSEEMLRRGWRVRVVARRGSERRRPKIYRYLKKIGIDVMLFDEIRFQNLKDLYPDVYVYLIGKIWGSRRELWTSHVFILNEVLEASVRSGSRLIYISAIPALGEVRGLKYGDLVFEEERHLDPKVHVHKNEFERSKAEGERLVVRSSAALGGRWTIIRPGLVMGRWSYHLEWRILRFLSRLSLGIRLYPVPVTPVRSLSRLIADASEGRYDSLWINAVSDNIDMVRISRILCSRLSPLRRCLYMNMNWLVRRAPGYPGALRMFKNLISRSYIYSSRILKGFSWESVEESINDCIEWLRSSDA